MATNPRIEELRRRIEKDQGSRLFAQLAEELRKDGELEDAIRVAREGLQKHPNYPSARMTLGRALLDTGDWAAARIEFELVLKGAADNILASRYLAECLENLGDRDAAIARYRATLAMAPGERHVLARLQELEKGQTGGSAPVVAGKAATPPGSPRVPPTTGPRPGSWGVPMALDKSARLAPPAVAAPPPPAPPPTAAAAPRPPIPLSVVEGEMELETSGTRREAAPAPASASPLAIPLVAADEEFELERPYDSPTTVMGRGHAPGAQAPPPAAPTPTAAAPPPTAATAPVSAEEQEFELEAPHEAPSTGWAATIRPLPPMEAPSAAPPRAPAMIPPAAPLAARPTVPAPSALISPTLGELYFNQGFTDKAIEVYRELNAREPGNERLSARLRELEKVQRALVGGEPAAAPARTDAAPPAAPTPTAAGSAAADRRQAIERTIVRLEALLFANRKG